MDNVLIALINKMPWEAVAAIVVLAPLFAIWVFQHLRWDEHHKIIPYWVDYKWEARKKHDQRTEDMLNEMLPIGKQALAVANANTEKITILSASINELSLEMLKNNFCTTDIPLGERFISAIQYLKRGGNGDAKQYITGKLRPLNPNLYDQLEKLVDKTIKAGS